MAIKTIEIDGKEKLQCLVCGAVWDDPLDTICFNCDPGGLRTQRFVRELRAKEAAEAKDTKKQTLGTTNDAIAKDGNRVFGLHECNRCGHMWRPSRATSRATVCPECTSRTWYIPRAEQVHPRIPESERKENTCQKCGWKWTPVRGKSLACPKCKRYDWREPKSAEEAGAQKEQA